MIWAQPTLPLTENRGALLRFRSKVEQNVHAIPSLERLCPPERRFIKQRYKEPLDLSTRGCRRLWESARWSAGQPESNFFPYRGNQETTVAVNHLMIAL